jgi:hypothetical protein
MRSKMPAAAKPFSRDIETVRHRLQEWRRVRKHGALIPEALWASAVKLAKEHRPAKVAHALGLDYNCLKKRLDSAVQDPMSEIKVKPTFIELLPSTPAPPCECTVELEHPHGGKMKIHIKGIPMVDLVALSHSLWSTQA